MKYDRIRIKTKTEENMQHERFLIFEYMAKSHGFVRYRQAIFADNSIISYNALYLILNKEIHRH